MRFQPSVGPDPILALDVSATQQSVEGRPQGGCRKKCFGKTRGHSRPRRLLNAIAIAMTVLQAVGPCRSQDREQRYGGRAYYAQNSQLTAEKYLEELQMASASKFGAPLYKPFEKAPSDSDFDRLIFEISRDLNLTASEQQEFRQKMVQRKKHFENLAPRSQYENPGLYLILELWSEKIRFAAKKNLKPHDVLDKISVAFGTLATGEVNALSLLVPSTNRSFVIAFESGFFDFVDLMSLAFSSTLPIEQTNQGYAVLSTNPSVVSKNIDRRPELQQRFLQIILAYLVEGRFDTLPATYLRAEDAIHDGVASRLFTAAGLFVLAHEYGHILRGDLAGSTVAGFLAGKQIRKIPHEWEQELGADALGIELTYLAMNDPKNNLASIIAGADFFLLCYDIVERSASMISNGDNRPALAGSDHPPTASRRVWIRQVLHQFLQKFNANGFSEDGWNAAVRDASNFDQIMEQLYAATQTSLRKLHDKRVGLAPSWLQRLSSSQ